jgi:hypothetical protein
MDIQRLRNSLMPRKSHVLNGGNEVIKPKNGQNTKVNCRESRIFAVLL